MLTLTPLTGSYVFGCPTCRAPLLVASPGGYGQPQGGPWAEDGDTLSFEAREHGGVAEAVDHYAELVIGRQCRCGNVYLAVAITTVSGSPDWAFQDIHYFGNGDRDRPTLWLAALAGRSWLVERHETALGPLLAHRFRPFAWSGEIVVGPSGLSACSGPHADGFWRLAANRLETLWPELANLQRRTSLEARSLVPAAFIM